MFQVEAEAVNRVLTIAKMVSCPIYFYSVTSQKSIDLINESRKSGTSQWWCSNSWFETNARYFVVAFCISRPHFYFVVASFSTRSCFNSIWCWCISGARKIYYPTFDETAFHTKYAGYVHLLYGIGWWIKFSYFLIDLFVFFTHTESLTVVYLIIVG